jgi:hypothetical protein
MLPHGFVGYSAIIAEKGGPLLTFQYDSSSRILLRAVLPLHMLPLDGACDPIWSRATAL